MNDAPRDLARVDHEAEKEGVIADNPYSWFNQPLQWNAYNDERRRLNKEDFDKLMNFQ